MNPFDNMLVAAGNASLQNVSLNVMQKLCVWVLWWGQNPNDAPDFVQTALHEGEIDPVFNRILESKPSKGNKADEQTPKVF